MQMGKTWLEIFLLLLLNRIQVDTLRHTRKQFLNLWATPNEPRMLPKVVSRIFNQLNKRRQQPVWMGTIDNQSLQQHPCDLLLHNLLFRFDKQVEH